jgi:nucleotide-binding universal stress UspA family protein
MATYKRILVPVDLHDLESFPLERAVDHAVAFGAELVFAHAHVWTPISYPDDSLALVNPIGEQSLSMPDEDQFESRLKDVVPLRGVPYRVVVRTGVLASVVADLVRELNCDLVITAHRHDRGLLHWFVRSGDEDILDCVEVPVLVLPN